MMGKDGAGIKFSMEAVLALTFQKPYLLDGVCHWAAELWMFVSWKLQAVERYGQVKAPWGLAQLAESWRGRQEAVIVHITRTRDTLPGKRADKPSVVRGEHPWEATESKAQFFIDHHHQDAPRIVLSRKPFKPVRSHPLLNGGSHCTSGTHFTDNSGRCGLNSDRRERRSAICKHFSCHFVSFFLNLTDLESGDINEKCRVGLSITACTNIATALPNILLPLGSWLVKQE
ncbi:uncharacterized protein LOC111553945 [Piliocolobus tephrosceles]|uniref:uncharacterized protein LOC111553945 n=1 Tax=Piliocolobus tephrosceles TaxID=591936 RepID=UPI000C2B3BBD|nr:uncharacterized protein LOC111553945 [Piliocolobus tephrosceles]